MHYATNTHRPVKLNSPRRRVMKIRNRQYGIAFIIGMATMLFGSIPFSMEAAGKDGSGVNRSQEARSRDETENNLGAGRMSTSERRIIEQITAAKTQKERRSRLGIQRFGRSFIRKSSTGQASSVTSSNEVSRELDAYRSMAPGATTNGLRQVSEPERLVPPVEEKVKPTWESRPVCMQRVPAPRGQIVDRNGEPLAQTRLCMNLGINFPTPLGLNPSTAIIFAREQISRAQRLIKRRISIDDVAISSHYNNRGVLPLDIAFDLTALEQKAISRQGGSGLILHPIYLRNYPNGSLAAHTLGYVGCTGPTLDGPLRINDLLWPETAGREGLELSFNDQLTGRPGQMTYNFDPQGKKLSETISVPPEQGCDVVTTLDVKLQRLCEKALATGCKRGAMVIMDPNNGDILAMASYPTFDPNIFIPAITQKQFKALLDNPNLPMLPRAFRSAYPPGSTFKVFVGIAALESRGITLDQTFPAPGSLQVGNIVMRNWTPRNSGMLSFEDALIDSCDTWFYQVGLRIGAPPIIDWALKFGFAAKTGIPLRSEAEGSIPTEDYLVKHNLPSLNSVGVANISIGQGDVLVTPLQMAQAMATIANGGTFHQTRLVQHVQDGAGKIVAGYDPRVRDHIPLTPTTLAALEEAMFAIVKGKRCTAPSAAVEGVDVVGKTGTAQWGPKKSERNAAWFAGFAPAGKPKYAFAALYESDPGQKNSHGGAVAAPMIGKVLREAFKLGMPNEMITESGH